MGTEISFSKTYLDIFSPPPSIFLKKIEKILDKDKKNLTLSIQNDQKSDDLTDNFWSFSTNRQLSSEISQIAPVNRRAQRLHGPLYDGVSRTQSRTAVEQ